GARVRHGATGAGAEAGGAKVPTPRPESGHTAHRPGGARNQRCGVCPVMGCSDRVVQGSRTVARARGFTPGLTRRSPLKGLGFAGFVPWPTGRASVIAKGTTQC